MDLFPEGPVTAIDTGGITETAEAEHSMLCLSPLRVKCCVGNLPLSAV